MIVDKQMIEVNKKIKEGTISDSEDKTAETAESDYWLLRKLLSLWD